MEYNTWKTPDGQWKGQLASPVVKGSTREEVIEKLKNMTKENSEIEWGVTRPRYRVKKKVEMYMVNMCLFASHDTRSVSNLNYYPPKPLAVGEVLISRWPRTNEESANLIYDYSVWLKDADYKVAFNRGMDLIEAARIKEEEVKGD